MPPWRRRSGCTRRARDGWYGHRAFVPGALVVLAFQLAACGRLPEVWPTEAPVAAAPTGPSLSPLDAAACREQLVEASAPVGLAQALAQSVTYLEKLPATRDLPAVDRRVAAGDLLAALRGVAGATTGGDLAAQVCDTLHVYRVVAPTGLLVTGYYQPELPASRTRSGRFRSPLYRTPPDLVDLDLGRFCEACRGRVTQGRVQDGTLVPYYSRADIEAGVLANRDLELAWLDDPVEAFFLHVQGSARLRFEDGVTMQVGYSGSNGRPYTSLGRVLIEQGKMPRESVSLQSLKAYLRGHPEEQAALMGANERYIFFRAVTAGPVGSLGVPLTPGRSVAADPTVYPPGGLVFMRVAPRDGAAGTGGQFATARLAVVQDTGVAITGAGRLDLFVGTGPAAEAVAGDLRNPGEVYLILP